MCTTACSVKIFIIGIKRRRCGSCDNCTMNDCGCCRFCLDKPKFGGRGTLKQACINKKCKKLN